ncbi:hypothetical protein ACIRL0_00595 [Streptomyces sp. NPDC102365]|uniref:hypothetical protein n=1 Tax=Streptomyces sp. NPDC102365 TaxID=3366162 RepID=UPI003803CE77
MADETGRWAAEEIAVLGGIPEYGSAEWLALELADPRRMAGLILAAERWRESQGGGSR